MEFKNRASLFLIYKINIVLHYEKTCTFRIFLALNI